MLTGRLLPQPCCPHPTPQGLGLTLLRNTPANAVYLGTFEVLKQVIAAQSGCKTTELSAAAITACAGG